MNPPSLTAKLGAPITVNAKASHPSTPSPQAPKLLHPEAATLNPKPCLNLSLLSPTNPYETLESARAFRTCESNLASRMRTSPACFVLRALSIWFHNAMKTIWDYVVGHGHVEPHGCFWTKKSSSHNRWTLAKMGPSPSH